MRRTVLLATAVAGGAIAGYLLYAKKFVPPAPAEEVPPIEEIPPEEVLPEHSLSLSAVADGTEIQFTAMVDSTMVDVPGSVTLPEGEYTIEVPDTIELEGKTYRYESFRVV